MRIRIRIGPADVLAAADATITGPAVSDNEEIIESMFEVGRFGLHIRFSDMALFVQRLGEDRVNREGTNPVLFDSVNFRPAPGVTTASTITTGATRAYGSWSQDSACTSSF